METDARHYEIAYLISPLVSEENVFGEAGKITGFLQDTHGVLGHIEEPKKIRLSYPIKKFREAHFGWTRFFIHPKYIADLEKKLTREETIIRYLIVEAEEEPVVTRLPKPRPEPRAEKPAPPQPEEKIDIEELDKRLEEILGK